MRNVKRSLWLWLIAFIGVLVPRRLRADWRQEWEAELQWREQQLAEWDKLDAKNKLALLWYSVGAFADALWLQPQRWEDEMFQDLRFGLRMLLKQPGFTLIAILTLVLGIGANTAIFSLVNAVWLRSLPYPEAERLTIVAHRNTKRGGDFELTPAAHFDLRQQSKSFEQLATYSARDFNLTGVGEPERLRGQIVSAALFHLLKVAPSAGRESPRESRRQISLSQAAAADSSSWR
jgi:hypothetical protein